MDSDLTEEQVKILQVLAAAKDRGKQDLQPAQGRPPPISPPADCIELPRGGIETAWVDASGFDGDGEFWSITPAGPGWLHLRNAIPGSDPED